MSATLQVFKVTGEYVGRFDGRRTEMLQVTVLVGEGSSQRSITRHISAWTYQGRNTEEAIRLHERAEASVQQTEKRLQRMQAELTELTELVASRQRILNFADKVKKMLKEAQIKPLPGSEAVLKKMKSLQKSDNDYRQALEQGVANAAQDHADAEAWLEVQQTENPKVARFELKGAQWLLPNKNGEPGKRTNIGDPNEGSSAKGGGKKEQRKAA